MCLFTEPLLRQCFFSGGSFDHPLRENPLFTVRYKKIPPVASYLLQEEFFI